MKISEVINREIQEKAINPVKYEANAQAMLEVREAFLEFVQIMEKNAADLKIVPIDFGKSSMALEKRGDRLTIYADDQDGLRVHYSDSRTSIPSKIDSPEQFLEKISKLFMAAEITQMPDVLVAGLDRLEDRVHNAKLDAKVASGDLFPKYAERRKKSVPSI